MEEQLNMLQALKQLYDIGKADGVLAQYSDAVLVDDYDYDLAFSIMESIFDETYYAPPEELLKTFSPEEVEDDPWFEDRFFTIQDPILDKFSDLYLACNGKLGEDKAMPVCKTLHDAIQRALQGHNSYYHATWRELAEDGLRCFLTVEYFEGWGVDLWDLDAWFSIYQAYETAVASLTAMMAPATDKILVFPVQTSTSWEVAA